MRNEITFVSAGSWCAGWHLPAETDAFTGQHGRPCVVMAHGFGGTRDTGLLAFAEAFAEAGIDAFVFDYRGFGVSKGSPRQLVSYRRQRRDYHAALAAARRLPGVDPDRIVLWGTSYSGGHVVAVAAQDDGVAAAISMNPATDGLAVLVQVIRYAGPGQLIRLTVHGLRDAAGALAGRAPHCIPIVGPPGSTAFITTPGAAAAYTEMAGPSWRNEVSARTALEVAFNRPAASVRRLTCPTLVQAGSRDSVAPPAAARRTAKTGGQLTQLREYPVDHFDFYEGHWQQRVLADQLSFLSDVLAQSRGVVHTQSDEPAQPLSGPEQAL
ncbi:MAG TPA: alpha/beta hydrolase [Mycobacterium sp.]